MKLPYILLAILVLILIGIGVWQFAPQTEPVGTATTTPTNTQNPAQVLSFEACVAAGYPVMESSPRQCRTPDGRTYAEEPTPAQQERKIVYNNASANDVVVTNPTPGSVTGKTVQIKGKARGTWYFEASFPVKILDNKGNVLASAPAQADGEWMTTEFVPFNLNLTVPSSYIGPATLVLEKDNASGLPERDASVSIPFTIEY